MFDMLTQQYISGFGFLYANLYHLYANFNILMMRLKQIIVIINSQTYLNYGEPS